MPSAVVTTLTPKELKDMWRTPPEFFVRVARRYGPFDLDAAATIDNRLCAAWLGPYSPLGEDALTTSWGIVDDVVTRAWCNPPDSLHAEFVAKAAAEAQAGRARTTLLLPSTTDVHWWHRHVWQETGPRPGVLVEFLSSRVSFLRADGPPSGQPNIGSVLVTFMVNGAD